MTEYIEREAAEELLSQPITMSMCLTREECLAKRSQRDIDVAILHSIPAADVREVKWISVEERKAEWPCICYDANGNLPFIPQGLLTITDAQGTWQIDAHLADPRLHQGKVRPVLGYGNRITHWMPLPEPPKEET